MSVIFTVSEIISKPVEEVFGFMAEPSNMNIIMPDIIASEKVGDDPVGIGTHIRETRKMMNKEVTGEVEISRYQPTSALGIKSEMMGISAEYIYTFTGTENGWQEPADRQRDNR
ncbi:MAG: hypothetical protein ACFCU6_09685 [Balneolaceae bacterium]